jgi:hypothetical protein
MACESRSAATAGWARDTPTHLAGKDLKPISVRVEQRIAIANGHPDTLVNRKVPT